CDWPAPRRVRTLITTRRGGVSVGPFESFNLAAHVGDDPHAVAENRNRLARGLPAPPRWLQQVHGINVADADDAQAWRAGAVTADAAVARSRAAVCAVLVADCLPVLLCDRNGSRVAVAHAGWRGLSAGILEATVAQMSAPADQLLAYLGPAIGPSAFEVGADVHGAFTAGDAHAESCFVPAARSSTGEPKWFADLFGLARRRLRVLGISAVFGETQCTYTDAARYFSYRRDGRSGRQAALIW